MKKMSPYMLVRKASLSDATDAPETSSAKPSAAQRSAKAKEDTLRANKKRMVDRLLAGSPVLARTFEELEPAFRDTLLNSCASSAAPPASKKRARNPGPKPGKAAPAPMPAAKGVRGLASKPDKTAPVPVGRSSEGRSATKATLSSAGTDAYLTQITHDLGRSTRVERVGLIDLGVWVAGLPDLLSRLNAAQDPYTLFEINAPVPAGLRKTAEGMQAWMSSHGVQLPKAQRAKLEPHVIADEFFTVAGDIRSGMGLDMIVGLIPVMVAGDADGEIYWNHFCSVSDGIALVSTADLREFAAKAGRPFEAAVGVLLVGAVLLRFNPKLEYHANRGCVFDYNDDRVGLIESIREPRICSVCAGLMDPVQKAAAAAMLGVLRKMKRKTT